MVISPGEVWWADVPPPAGSEPGFRRPVVVVHGDALNRSRIATVVCVPLTSNLKWSDAPGNVRLNARVTSLSKDSVAIEHGLDDYTVMSISGHSSTRMLERYTHPTLERRIAALDTF